MIQSPGRKSFTITALFLLSFLLLCLSAFTQSISEKGYYLTIRNFSPREYKNRPQNWAVIQDLRGILFFGNNKGVLEFDGIFWRNIDINGKAVFSLAADEMGTIFIGAENELGYLEPDVSGTLQYHSLLSYLDKNIEDFGSVWKTCISPEGTYFQTSDYIFRWNGDTIKTWQSDKGFHTSFFVNNKYFVREQSVGLCVMEDDSLVMVVSGDKFANTGITGMIPYLENDILVVTDRKGLFHLTVTENNEQISLIKHFNEIDNFLTENYINCAIRINDNQFVLGSDGNGVLLFDQSTDQFDIINYISGLQDEVVNALLIDSRGNLWMALSNGISMSPAGSAVTSFGYNAGLKETVEAVTRFNKRIFVATQLGCFYLTDYQTNKGLSEPVNNTLYNEPGFKKIDNIDEACFNLFHFNTSEEDLLLVAAFSNVSQIDKKFTVSKIIECAPWSLYQSKLNPARVIIANEYGVESIYRKGQRWIKEGKVEGINDDCRVISEDQRGNFWIGTYNIGVLYKIKYTGNMPGSSYEVSRYDSLNGLPEGDIYPAFVNNKLLFGTSAGIYKLNENKNVFVPDTTFGSEFGSPAREIHRMSTDHSDNLWLVTYKDKTKEYETGYMKLMEDGHYEWVREPFLSFSKGVIHGLYHDPDGITWFGGPDGLFRYDDKVQKNYKQDYYALIRRVIIRGDSTIFNGAFTDNTGSICVHQDPKNALLLPYRYNSITFEYSAPNNEDGTPVLFSNWLEGFDAGWSEWSSEYRREYTNLRERSYTFHVKAKNLYAHESIETTYSFVVRPPWYRTIPAYFAFVILAIALVFLIVVLYTRELRRIIRLRTAEIRMQKDKIEAINRDIMDSIQYAQRIQSALLPPGDYIDSCFPERFILYLPRNVVSGDFYWIASINGKVVAVTADCTGHGVPGAMMSMLGMAYLNEIIGKASDLNADRILNQLRSEIVKSLRQKGQEGESQDGMDMALFILDTQNLKLEYSGANMALHMIRNSEIQTMHPDRMPIGISSYLSVPFTRQVIDVRKGDILYTFSDGFQDQFGGPDNKKFMIKKLRALLTDIHTKSMSEQKTILNQTLTDWMGSNFQVDDILVMGIKV